MQPPGQPPKPNQLRIEIPANLNATYSNAAIINHTHTEVICDFMQIMPNDPRARVQARVIMTPAAAKVFLRALSDNLARYESTHGEIPVAPGGGTLADQLFRGARPEDGE